MRLDFGGAVEDAGVAYHSADRILQCNAVAAAVCCPVGLESPADLPGDRVSGDHFRAWVVLNRGLPPVPSPSAVAITRNTRVLSMRPLNSSAPGPMAVSTTSSAA
jgi:hypothetical protein